MKIDLTDLCNKQKDLDLTIANNHHITYATTHNQRVMALLVEVGELANATRCFKFWSVKPSESKERVLDEYADGMHFLLSLGIELNIDKKIFNYQKRNCSLTDQFLEVYNRINIFYKKNDINSYRKAFVAFLELIPLLGFKSKDVINAYYLKLGENYHRQETNY